MAFSLVPLHILVICLSLLCSNHITEAFGNGIVPKKYRLGVGDVQLTAESFGYGKLRNKDIRCRPLVMLTWSMAVSLDHSVGLVTSAAPRG